MAKDSTSLDYLLNRVAGHVSARGVDYPVIACNAPDFQLIERVESDDPPTMVECLALAKRLCPSLPDEIWQEADSEIVGVIFAKSCVKVRRVQAELPNSSGATTAPAPSPET